MIATAHYGRWLPNLQPAAPWPKPYRRLAADYEDGATSLGGLVAC